MAKFESSNSSSDWRTYHLRVPVRSYFWEAVRGESRFGRTPKPTPELCSDLGAIAGIQSFYTREGYELIIHKAGAYDWSEIEETVAKAVDEHDARAEWTAFAEDVPEDVLGIPEPEDDSDYAYEDRS